MSTHLTGQATGHVEAQLSGPDPAGAPCQVRMGTAPARWILAASILATGMAFLDGTVVNVALRAIGADLDADLADLQWVVNAYLLVLAALILLAGSLADLFGRRRVFLIGVVWFAAASVACGLAQDPTTLIAARALQGVGGALLTPGSLAIIQSAFHKEDRAAAIGAWSGMAGVTTALGPVVGGWLVQSASWRYVFWINVPLAVVVVVIALRHVPESRNPDLSGSSVDITGAALGAVGLGGLTYALIEMSSGGALPLLAGVVGMGALVAFVLSQRHGAHPMVPPSLFRSRAFNATNGLTLVVYGALGGLTFLLVLQLQVVAGYTPLEAGVATLPLTLLMLLFSSWSGRLATRLGPRPQLTLGPALAAGGTLLLAMVDEDASYWLDVLPGVVVFGAGLTLLVAPLTATVLAAAPDRHAGVASGVNNAIARTGSLLAVAALPVLVGLSGDNYEDPQTMADGYIAGMVACAALLLVGGLVAFLGLARSERAVLAR